MKLSNKIEAILFFKAEPMSVSAISKILNVSEEDVRSAISEMKNTTDERGIILLEKNGVYMLGTHPDISPVIEKITKEELSRDLTELQSFEETLREEEASQEQKEVQEELTEEENV